MKSVNLVDSTFGWEDRKRNCMGINLQRKGGTYPLRLW